MRELGADRSRSRLVGLAAHPGALAVVAVVLVGVAGLPRAAPARQEPQPDPAARAAELEQLFQVAIELSARPDADPIEQLMTWGTVLQSAVVLHQVQKLAGVQTTAASPQDATLALLDRWQELQPEAGGPDLFRATSLEDQEAQQAAVVALAERHPDDSLIVWRVAAVLRHRGENEQARQLVEGFSARHPEQPLASRLVAEHYSALEDAPRHMEALERWARVAPEDPRLIQSWLASRLPQEEPEQTARLLERFFDAGPTGHQGLGVCIDLMRRGDPVHGAGARACVARFAADPDPASQVAEQATSALVAQAAADGDWADLLSALEKLPPEAQARALLSATSRLDAPERCAERIELLASVWESGRALPSSSELKVHRSVASGLSRCDARPGARDLFLDILRSVPAAEVWEVVGGWVAKVNGVWRGELPAEVVPHLEQRLESETEVEALYRTLDVAYQLGDAQDRRFELLRRWQQRLPETLRTEEVLALAWELVYRERGEEAATLLEQRLESASSFDPEIAETLWGLYAMEGVADDGAGGAIEPTLGERAERYAGELVASGEPRRVSTGHRLAARAALQREDLEGAERHLWQALRSEDTPPEEVAVELLFLTAMRGDEAELPALARRICEETWLSRRHNGVDRCTVELLGQSDASTGSGQAAAAMLAAQGGELPEDPKALRELAERASGGGDIELEERAIRRLFELDPRDPEAWQRLGQFFARQGELEELEELVSSARRQFEPPPLGLLSVLGKARLTAGRPRLAIDALLEARAGMTSSYSRAWLDQDLHAAYAAYGRTLPAPSRRTPAAPRGGWPAVLPALPAAPILSPDATADELLHAAEALRSGSGGRFDQEAALRLFERAAATGHPLAVHRLALVRHLDSPPEERAPGAGPPTAVVAPVRERASAGDAYAQQLVGTAALLGFGEPEDAGAARRWLASAAARGAPWAWHNLAWMAESGEGLETPDEEAALDGYRRSAEEGNAVSMLAFARLTLVPHGSGPLCAEGLRWLERAAGAGHGAAAAFLGKILYYGRGQCVAREKDRARPWLEAGVAAGELGSAYDLALALIADPLELGSPGAASEPPDRATGDSARALRLLEEIAALPDALALETLGFLYATGVGVPRDAARARAFVADAARHGSDGLHHLGQNQEFPPFQALLSVGVAKLEALAARSDAPASAFLAGLYFRGIGVPSDVERARQLATTAAAAGEGDAMRTLGHVQNLGHDVPKDHAAAVRWWREGAEAGDSFSMMFYAHALRDGEDVAPDPVASLAWLTRSAEAGNWWATVELARLLEEGGPGARPDREAAIPWRQLLAERGEVESRGWLAYHEAAGGSSIQRAVP